MIVVRKANETDIESIYLNLHKKFVEKYSEKTQNEEKKAHRNWYKFLINSPNYLLYMIERNEFLGILKFELEEDVAVISIYLKKSLRGKGYGKKIVEIGLDELKYEKHEIKTVLAYILEENEASLRLFKGSGFDLEGLEEHKGLEHQVYSKRLSS